MLLAPKPEHASNPTDNFAPLTTLAWQVHAYGNASRDIETICRDRELPLHVFSWRPQMRRTGLLRDAVYLVRPDGYVALAGKSVSAAELRAYLDARRIVQVASRYVNRGIRI